MHSQEIALKPATELRNLIGKKALSVAEVIQASLEQIDRHNDTINAVVTLNEHALNQAKKLDELHARNQNEGLLFGLPVGIKDVTPVAGLHNTFGSKLFADHIASEDALIVRRLKQAGAIIIGKTNTPEFTAGGNTFNEVFGRTRNPWNPNLSAGGSTGGGAAALATGMIALAEGTDLGGSLRIPASFCGLVGLRPSPGLVPTYPSDYLWDYLEVSGPMARTAEDVALMLQAVSGHSPLTPVSQSTLGRDFLAVVQAGIPKGLHLAYCADIAGIGIDAGLAKICRQAALHISQVGAQVEEIAFDLAFARKAFLDFRGYWFVSKLHRHLDKLSQLSENVRDNIQAGLKLTIQDLAASEQTRREVWQKFHTFFEKYDFLLTPCMAVPPFPVEENYPRTVAGKKMQTYVDWIAPTFLLSLTSLPVASVPCGLDENGLPVGLQIVGRPRGEETVLALAKQVQGMHPVGLPPLTNTES
ncbi:MAG: amidase [bacterium]